MGARELKTRLILLTGHRFGVAAFRGILSSAQHCPRQLEVTGVLALHPRNAVSTVGFEDAFPVEKGAGIDAKYFHSVRYEQVAKYLVTSTHVYLMVIGPQP